MPRLVAIALALTFLALPNSALAKKKKSVDADSDDPKPTITTPIVDDRPYYGPELAPIIPEQPVIVAPAPYKFTRGRFLVGARAGALFPEAFSNLGPNFLVGIEVGWVLPKLPGIGRGLTITLDLAYTQPEASGSATDARIGTNSGAYQWSLTQRELILGLNVIYRVNQIGSGRVVPYVGIGPRIFFLQSTTGGQADAGNNFAAYNEQSTRIGMGLPVGVDISLGPGRIFGEAMLLYAPFNHNVTGASNAGAISVEAGYRFLL